MGCLAGLHRKYPNNPIIGYLNINSLRNKIIDLRHVVSVSQPDILAISETKLDDTFPDAQFRMDGYYSPAQFRRDRNKHGGGLMVFIRNGIPVKRSKTYEPSNQEAICFEVTITKRKWIIYVFYRSESYSKLDVFLEEFKKSVNKAISKYENIILIGDINVDIPQKKVLVQSFVLSNFNYCPAIWHFCSEKNLHKMESVQLRALRFVHNDYHSAYSKLLDKSNMCTLELRRIHSISTEIYKTINRIGPNYMVSLISHNQQQYSSRRPLNLFIPRMNQSTFGLKVFITWVHCFGIAFL